MHMLSKDSKPRLTGRQAYVEAGADMIFAEALTTLDEYQAVHRHDRCAGVGQPDRVRQYTAFYDRSRNLPAPAFASCFIHWARPAQWRQRRKNVYRAIREDGTQKASSTPCKHERSCTRYSATTPTKTSSMQLFAEEKGK